MSNPTTYFLVGGTDLSSIFQPYSGGTPADPTGFKVNGQDLNTIFEKYTTGGDLAAITGY